MEETNISAARALRVAEKYMMLNSITKSQRIIGMNKVERFIVTSSIPKMAKIEDLNWEELRNLKIAQVQWHVVNSIGFTLSDGQTC